MTQPDPIQLDLDPSGYVAGLNQASSATGAYDTRLGAMMATASLVPGAMQKISSHLPLAGFVALASGAASTQQAMSPLRATTTVLGANFGTLAKSTDQLARQFPIGNAGARQLTGTLVGLGLLAKGQESQISSLAKVYVKLGAANGEGPSALAAGMTQLSRVTNSGFNVQRIQAIGDSLTTVSAKSGASATNVLAFSRLIAPLASSAGIGTTKILGISAAFSKLGEDGSLGANAFNKMLGDLNKSVRDGSPVLANYASVVGKTQAQFMALAKSDPTEAIVQVTEAIAKAGNNGPRLLEQLGLEGPRTQRVLQQLSAGGGLRQSISDATGSYNSGASNKGSQASFSTLMSATDRFGSTLQQVTEALGGPFLGALTKATNIAGTGVGAIRSVVSSGPVQTFLKGLADVGIPALLAMKFLGGGIKATLFGQAATSGPVRGVLAGLAQARGEASGMNPRQTLFGRLGGAKFLDLQEQVARGEATLGTPKMVGVNEGAARLGGRLGGFAFGTGGTGPSVLRTLFGGGVGAAAVYMKMNEEQARLARTPFGERDANFRPAGAPYVAWKAEQDRIAAERTAGRMSRLEATGAYGANLRNTATAIGEQGLGRNLASLGGGFFRMAESTAVTGISALGTGLAKGVGRLATGLGGPIGLGLMGATFGFEGYQRSQAETAQRATDTANATSFIDDYRVAMGKATTATSTLAGAMTEASKRVGTTDKPMTLDQIQVAAAQAGGSNRVRNYSGMSSAAVKRQLSLEQQSGQLGPQELQRVQQDLFLSGFTRGQVGDITGGLTGQTGGLTQDLTKQIAGVVADQAKAPGKGGLSGFFRKAMDNNNLDFLPGHQGRSERGNIDILTARTLKDVDTQLVEMKTRAGERAGQYGPEYAARQQVKEIDAAVSAAYKAGNTDLAQAYEKGYEGVQGANLTNSSRIVDRGQIAKAGGSFTRALANVDKNYAGGVYATAMSGSDVPKQLEGYVQQTLSAANNPLASLFSVGATGPAADALQKLVGPAGSPESPQAQQAANEAVTRQATESGMSLQQLAENAMKAANSMGDVSDANSAFLQRLAQTATQQAQVAAGGGSSSSQAILRIQQAQSQVALSPQGAYGQQQREMGIANLGNEQMASENKAKAILTQYRENQVAQARAGEDYRKQQLYAEQDYGTALTRTVEQYGIAVSRTERQYNLQRTYSVEDFGKQRLYAEQDFAKQMSRAATDAAKAMYDPFQRIQVQPVWDSTSLLGNLREQTDQIARQMANLSTLRTAGGSNAMITLLGLNDPKNAQQLASIIDDLHRDPKVVASLNAAAGNRNAQGSALFGDAANVGSARPAEDFATSMARSDKTFAQSMERAALQEKTTLSDMANDQGRTLRNMAQDRDRAVARSADAYATMVKRMGEDIKRADQEITGTLDSLSGQLDKALKGQFVDFGSTVSSVLQGAKDELATLAPQLAAAAAGAASVRGALDGNGGGSGGSGPTTSAGGTAGGGMNGGGFGDAPVGGGTQTTIERGPGGRPIGTITSSTAANAYVNPGTGQTASSGGGDYHRGAGNNDYRPSADFMNKHRANPDFNRSIARSMMSSFGWGPEEFPALNTLWNMESNWNQYSDNPGSDAYGIPQALPGNRLSEMGSDWRTNPATQIKWGMNYIKNSTHGYKTPSRALQFHIVNGWYANGGIATRPHIGVVAEGGSPEAMIPLNERGVGTLAEAMKRFISPDDARGLQASHGVSYHTYDYSSTTHDNRVVIEHVDLVADNPRDLAAALAAKARLNNLTAPAQRKS